MIELRSIAELDQGLLSRVQRQTSLTPTGCELDLPLERQLSFGACYSSSTAQMYMSINLEMAWSNPTPPEVDGS
ncbi:hypothetical protein JOB18_013518 [Solea senegalensis]|uniref:Uncharacterized protein n=1 Tax=Solea senegalensis TaxID=28829 RepID=A0AAV6PNG6_SOLSE|nr:hypothetical protein JOB18_013518 [Solea senegalensis]